MKTKNLEITPEVDNSKINVYKKKKKSRMYTLYRIANRVSMAYA